MKALQGGWLAGVIGCLKIESPIEPAASGRGCGGAGAVGTGGKPQLQSPPSMEVLMLEKRSNDFII